MRKLMLFGALFFLAARPALPQASTIPRLTLDASPAETDMLEIRKVGDARDKRTTRSTFFSASKSCSAGQVVAAPSGGAGLLTCRLLVAADIPALAYVTSLTMPADFSVAGTTALTVTRTSQSANLVLASPNGSSGTPTYRALAFADLPTLATGKLYGSVSASTAAPGAVTVSTGLNLSTSGVLTATGSGTVSSVAQTVPSWLTVTGSPVTTTGTLAIAAATGQTANRVIGTCNGATTFAPCQINLPTDVTGVLPAGSFPALTGAVTTSAGSLATTLAASQTITTPVLNKPTIGIVGTAGSSHIKAVGTSPTVSCTGTGTGGTATVAGPDLAAIITITAGTSAGSTGVCTLTYNGTFTNPSICAAMLSGGSWQVTSTIIQTFASATAPQFTWSNNNNGAPTTLTNATTYAINIICIER